MREVSYDEIYELFDNCDPDAKIDLGNGEYAQLTDYDNIMDLGIESEGGFYLTVGDICLSYAELLTDGSDFINTFVYELNNYIVEREKEAA